MAGPPGKNRRLQRIVCSQRLRGSWQQCQDAMTKSLF
jgi:hypothetical protein